MTNRLTPIVEQRRLDVVAARRQHPLATVEAALATASPTRGFRQALARPGLQVIAEIKRRSPSMGTLNADADPADMAERYQAGGAAALSVLTEPHYFSGALDDLVAARGACDLPVLRKDFVVDPYQLAEARAAGADAALLIVAVLGETLGEFLDAAKSYGLDALVEVHDEAELEIAAAAGSDMIGVNNRNLSTLVIDLAVSERLRRLMPPGIVAVAESGLEEVADFTRMHHAGYDAVLVGTALMRSGDPTTRLKALLGGTGA
jgi:indole-3-glycerol phosphate synthase